MILLIEGVDGAGKGTQAAALAERLAPRFRSVETLHFPVYDSLTGRAIKRFLSGELAVVKRNAESDAEVQALALQSLMLVNRLEFWPKLIEHANQGTMYVSEQVDRVGLNLLILDRYTPSALAYGAADGLLLDFLERVHECLPQPTFAFLLDIPVEESFRRRPVRDNAYEAKRERLEAARQVYLDVFARRRWCVVDGCRPAGEITEEIARAVEKEVL